MFESQEDNLFLNQITLSLLTPPLLFGLMTLDILAENVQELGKASEEIFRGDRLPILKVSESEDHT